MASPSLSVSPYPWRDVLTACVEGRLPAHLGEHHLPVALLIAGAVPPRDGEPYGRLPLFRDHLGEVLLVRWREDTFCAPHDHGAAGGFVCLLRGRLVERSWRWQPPRVGRNREPEDLVFDHQREHTATAFPASAPTTIIPVLPHAIHDMKASDEAVAVHFYFPAILGMTVFDLEGRESLVVTEDCGAWIPRDRALVVKRSPWGAPRAA